MIVILISVVLAIFGSYREYRRPLKRYLLWRMLAIISACIALACLALPLTYKAGKTASADRFILLTDGFDKDSLQVGKTDSVYTLQPTVKQQYPKAKLLIDISQLTGKLIYVFGYGLSADELDELDSTAIIFHPSPQPKGITTANWTDHLIAGQNFSVSIKHNNTAAKACKVLLKGLNTPLDSANVAANAETAITLKTQPKGVGKMVYELLVIAGKDTLQHEQLPVVITPIKPLKVLMLSASPDFESRFLRTWLVDNGYSVASRSAISKGKISQEYLNIDKTNLSRLSASALKQFDVLICDQSSLQSINPSEEAALQQAIGLNGLGIIIRADSSDKPKSWLLRDLKASHINGKQLSPTTLQLSGKGKTNKLPIEAAYITQNSNIQSLITDAQQHVMAATSINGAGKIILTTINNTYSWQLSGNKTDYTNLWAMLIGKAARKEIPAVNWQIQGPPAMVGSAATILFEADSAINNLHINGQPVSPAQSGQLLYKQTLNFWPSAAGWQNITADGMEPNWWYVWKKGGWKSLNAAGKISRTAAYAKIHSGNASASQQLSDNTRQPVPKIYFFILFLMATTFLWAERKFINT